MPWTAADIPDQHGRTAVVTGANTGLGLATARELARQGASVVLAVRDPDKGHAAGDDIRRTVAAADLEVLELDLASLASVRAAADQLHDAHDHLDLLVNNAGVMMTPHRTTEDGFELQMGVNHLGHFALTGLLLDLLAVDGARVVSVSSNGHRMGGGLAAAVPDDLDWERSSYDRTRAYGRSKLANLLFTYELQRRLVAADAPTAALAAHPGVSDTELVRHLPSIVAPLSGLLAQDAAAGALPTLRAATDPAALGGQYYGPRGPGQFRGAPTLVASSERSLDGDLQRRLWEASVDKTGVDFPV